MIILKMPMFLNFFYFLYAKNSNIVFTQQSYHKMVFVIKLANPNVMILMGREL